MIQGQCSVAAEQSENTTPERQASTSGRDDKKRKAARKEPSLFPAGHNQPVEQEPSPLLSPSPSSQSEVGDLEPDAIAALAAFALNEDVASSQIPMDHLSQDELQREELSQDELEHSSTTILCPHSAKHKTEKTEKTKKTEKIDRNDHERHQTNPLTLFFAKNSIPAAA